MTGFRLNGLIAAPYTPIDRDGDLQLPVIEKYCAHLLKSGVSGAFVCGTTGEGLSLTTEERMQVARQWVQVAGPKLPVIVHVGHNSQRDAIALAEDAVRCGAAAISAVPPFFFKPVSIEQLIDFMKPIAAAAGNLPFYYYHIPSMTRVNFSMAELLNSAAEAIPTFAGIKFTHGDLMDYQRCQSIAANRFDVAWGVDEMLLGALAIGAKAAVGSTYNYAAPLYIRMMQAFAAGDLEAARACSREAAEIVAVLLKLGVLRTGKALMTLAGVDCGAPRAPIAALTPEQAMTVRSAWDRLTHFL